MIDPDENDELSFTTKCILRLKLDSDNVSLLIP